VNANAKWDVPALGHDLAPAARRHAGGLVAPRGPFTFRAADGAAAWGRPGPASFPELASRPASVPGA